jgi:AraC-like DNA-binding protein
MRTQGAFTSIRPPKIEFYLRFMEKQGFSAGQFFANSGLSKQLLDEPYTTISIPTYIRLVSNMLNLTGMPDLAFRMGKEFRLGDLGVLGLAFATSRNIDQGIEVWQKYNRHFFGSLIAVREIENHALHSYEFLPRVQLQPHLLRFFVEEYLNISVPLFKEMGGFKTRDQYFSFTFSAPEHRQLYEELLEANVVFNGERNLYSIYTDEQRYTNPFPLANRESFELCISHLDNLSTIDARQSKLSDRIRLAVIDTLPEVLTVSAVAEKFNMSSRTLFRELKNENVSYQQILDGTREEEAINYLTVTSLSVGEIASLLGYSDTRSFRRAFKAWQGQTITEFRSTL